MKDFLCLIKKISKISKSQFNFANYVFPIILWPHL
jgi:hypothetical protein